MTIAVPIIKICGITTAGIARQAIHAGADMLGLVFYAESPRAIDFGVGQLITRIARTEAVDKPVRIVAVFVEPPEELVEGVIEYIEPDLLQFHGFEKVEHCTRWDHPFMKAHLLGGYHDVDAIEDFLVGKAEGYLIEAFTPGSFGGTGRQLRPNLIRAGLKHPRGFIAGGLTAKNVGPIIKEFEPYGVDVSSGVETRPGIKNAKAMSAFVAAVRDACVEQ